MSPYKSEAQRKYFNANREKLESQGVDVDKWNRESAKEEVKEKRRFRQRAGFSTHLKGTK